MKSKQKSVIIRKKCTQLGITGQNWTPQRCGLQVWDHGFESKRKAQLRGL